MSARSLSGGTYASGGGGNGDGSALDFGFGVCLFRTVLDSRVAFVL